MTSSRQTGAGRLSPIPVLLLCALVLAGTPIGEAALLQIHLLTAHRGESVFSRGPTATLSALAQHYVLEPEVRTPHGDVVRGHGHDHDHDDPETDHRARHARGEPHGHDSARPAAVGHGHRPQASDHRTVHGPGERHEHAPPARQRAPSASDDPPSGRRVAWSEPHEHRGVIHTHEPAPEERVFLTIAALSKFFLTTPILSWSPTERLRLPVGRGSPEPQELARLVETPPPRLDRISSTV